MAARNAKEIFVAMPFKKQYDPVFNAIKQAAELTNMIIYRVDQEPFHGSIINHIRNRIDGADYMIAVATEENGNVYYEIGLAHCQKKPVIILTSDPDTLKFDLKDHRSIVYDQKHPRQLVDELVKHLSLLQNTESDPQTHLAVRLGGNAVNLQSAYDKALEKAKQAIIQQARLEEPVQITRLEMRPNTGDIAIEVRDFLRVRIRAIIDVNGFVQTLKRIR